jgi:hypothetical protein
MAVSKQLFGDWKRNPVTQELMQELREGVEKVVSQMVVREIPDSAKDQFCRAFVRVADDVINWQPEFLQEEGANAQD